MKKLLITGFEPFGGEKINPSWETVLRLPSEVGGYTLTKMLIPVVFLESAEKVRKTAEEIDADVILCIGQAGGRNAITPELVGINLKNADIPDNQGNAPKDEQIVRGGDCAYFSTIPVRKMAQAICDIGVESRVSYSAGAYVCNDVIYTLLHYFKNTKTKVGFIHLPYCKEQGKEPNMEIETMVQAIQTAIENIDE